MRFEDAVEIILYHEGGYVNDPNDPGGETNFGISKRAHPNVDIKNLTKEEAIAIYRKHYWEKMNCDALPSLLRLPAFDCAVNQGVSRASKWLQEAAGVKQDGIIGPQTLLALHGPPIAAILPRFNSSRLNAYLSNENFGRFGRGWMKRYSDIVHRTLFYQGET